MQQSRSTAGDHEFAEEITDDGVLTWQSQPAQLLTHPMIKTFISHNDLTDSIHLFLRTKPSGPYVYSGTLGYLDHDPTQEAPVQFSWQLLEWPPPTGRFNHPRVGVATPETAVGKTASVTQTAGLHWIEPPAHRKQANGGQSGVSRQPILPDQDARNAKLGRAGEDLVVAEERNRLVVAGRPDLADKVVHVSVDEGDHVGYDIRSYDVDEIVRHIEVKTTRGAASTAFFISPNELKFSDKNPKTYELWRLCNYQGDPPSASCYIIRGAVRSNFELTATEYRAQILPKDTSN